MDSKQGSVVDWVSLPEGTATFSLWDTLHDGDVLAIESDLPTRTVTFRFDVDYVRDFHQLPERTQFVVVADGVQSVRCLRSVPWPGSFSMPTGISREEQSNLINEYHRKWREESFSWPEFERLTSEGLEVSNATLAQSSNGVALQLGLMVANDRYVEAYLRGEGVKFYVGDKHFKAEEFVRIGEAYWEAFANKNSGERR